MITKTHNLVGKNGRGGKAQSLSEGESDHNIHLLHKHNVVFWFFLNYVGWNQTLYMVAFLLEENVH